MKVHIEYSEIAGLRGYVEHVRELARLTDQIPPHVVRELRRRADRLLEGRDLALRGIRPPPPPPPAPPPTREISESAGPASRLFLAFSIGIFVGMLLLKLVTGLDVK